MVKSLLFLSLFFELLKADNFICATIKSDGVVVEQIYDEEGHLISLDSSDNSVSYSYTYDNLGRLIEVYDHVNDCQTKRTYDSLGNLLKETLSSGFTLERQYDKEGKQIILYLPDRSYISYEYEDNYLKAINRYNNQEEKIYAHYYTTYDCEGKLLSQELIGGIGRVDYSFDAERRRTKISSPFFQQEIIGYDAFDNVCQLQDNQILRCFSYDEKDRLIYETGKTTRSYSYATDLPAPHEKSYTYDALNRLISIEKDRCKITFTYDAYHRLISKTIQTPTSQKTLFYLYDDQNEIGALDASGNLIELRILAPHSATEIERGVAFELEGEIYAPIYDLFGNVSVLISLSSSKIDFFEYTAFREENLSYSKNPWRLSSKRFDKDCLLYFFGRRFYDPQLRQWISADPAGDLDGQGPYTYLLNNPYKYLDLDGLKSHKRKSFWNYVHIPQLFLNPFSFIHKPKIKPKNYDLTIENDSHIFFVNGINNSFEEAKKSASFISDMAAGLNVHGTYSPSKGFFKDCFNYFKKFKHKYSSSARILQNHIENHIEKYPSQPILIICHSNGVNVTRKALINLEESKRKQISVIAIAPAAFILDDLCKSVHHYESLNDFVPKLDQKGRALSKKNITKLKKHRKAFWFDHTFTSPTYRESLQTHIDQHLQTHTEDIESLQN